MAHKTLEIHSIPIPPHLAGQLKQALGRSGTGFDEGAFLQQLHFWTLNPATTGWSVDGVKWVYNSLKAWLQQFPWMSEYGLRKAIANLKKLGLIQTAQHWITSYKRVMFYRIDYEQLKTFAGEVCDLITTRCVNSDLIDEQSAHRAGTDISSNISSSEQQTVVALEGDESFEETGCLEMLDCDPISEEEVSDSRLGNSSPASSGNSPKVQRSVFPELVDAVAQAIDHPPGAPLPIALKKAISQFPDRVQSAISYLKHQQQKRQIHNPVGYLYEAISSGWNLRVDQSPTVPMGFSQWFNQAKAQGLVVAAMTINGIHYTLHVQQGWLPTAKLMKDNQQP
jgi:hypothetical protein